LSQVISLPCCIFEQDFGVITMAMIGKVRRLHFRQKKSVREIARITSLSRNTVQKWLTAPVTGEPKYRRVCMPRKLTAFSEVLEQWLKADSHLPKKGRRSAKKLFTDLGEAGYKGGYTRVTDFIREWRRAQGEVGCGRAFVPLERGAAGGGRHLLPGTGLAHEAVRQPGVLAGGLPEPGARDAV